jgi:glycine oxidase
MTVSQRRVAIIGAGVVGCATAYELARAGLAVTLIERDAIAAHASGCNAGNLNPLQGTPAALLPFALQAFRIHAEIRAELIALGCTGASAQPVTRIYLGYDETDRQPLRELAAAFQNTDGFSAGWLSRAELRRLEPRLAEDTDCGVLAAGNLTVDGREFTRALAAGAVRLGCSICHDAASGVVMRGERVTGVQTGQGLIACDDIVFATGPWTSAAHSWLDIDVPIEPVKGEILLMRLAEGPPLFDLTWGPTSIYRRRGGEVWVGTTMKKCGLDAAPTEEAKEFLLAGAARMMPAMGGAMLLEHVSALRPMSVSGAPIAARAPGWQNVYIANGGGAKGMLLSAGIGRTIRDLLLELT